MQNTVTVKLDLLSAINDHEMALIFIHYNATGRNAGCTSHPKQPTMLVTSAC